jgi:putative nucleotidyltransferase with HDIG domain
MELAEARALVKDKADKDITVRHLVSVEGVMRALARRLRQDEDRWALAGLFHDLDQDQTGEDPQRHAFLAAAWLRAAGVEEPVVNAVLAHAHERYRTDLMARAVVHADAIAGLLVATHSPQITAASSGPPRPSTRSAARPAPVWHPNTARATSRPSSQSSRKPRLAERSADGRLGLTRPAPPDDGSSARLIGSLAVPPRP